MADNFTFAQNISKIVIDYVKEFARSEYKVDTFKTEFPADLKYCKEFSHGGFDGKKRQIAYSLSELKSYCKNISEASSVPWIVLSGGVGIKEFLMKVKLATNNGASGFLGGRAIWEGAVQFYPDTDKMKKWLLTTSVDNSRGLHKARDKATAWYNHRKLKDFTNVQLDMAGENRYAKYEEL